MATHFFFSPHKLSLSHTRLLTAFQHQPPSRNQNLAICCSSINKFRASRKVMSDEELCNELKEFISVMIFPEDHVPSMKDLSLHGRNDLAYIVRRRGYKRISELLASSRDIGGDEFDIDGDLLEKLDGALDCEIEAKDLCQDVKVDNLDEHESLMNVTVEYLTQAPVMKADERSSTNVESLAELSLKEKVETFIETGELDVFEDDAFGILKESGAEVLNDGSSDPFEPPAKENFPPRNDFSSTETPISADSDNDMEAGERENQAEISNLKIMLQQKELELSRLKEQVEKEKIALSELQFKAESEINKALKLVSEKDEELHAAEESLSGLKEVVVQYECDGEIVEVAGSFNGWYRRIPLDPQPPSSTGSRKSRLWSTVVWLYPGEYEIKFIVDGEWMIDPRRESVTRGSVHNNILRVDN